MISGVSLCGNQHENEDVWGYLKDFAWVIDGASNPYIDPESTQKYVERLATALQGGYLASKDADVRELLASAIEEAGEPSPDCPSATVSLARWGEDYVDWLVLGDSAIMFRTEETPLKIYSDRRLDNVATEVREKRSLAGKAKDEKLYSQLTHELLKQERETRNVSGGFWVAQNKPEAAYEALTGRVSIDEFALMTDGVAEALESSPLPLSFAFKRLKTDIVEEVKDLREYVSKRTEKIDDMTAVFVDRTV